MSTDVRRRDAREFSAIVQELFAYAARRPKPSAPSEQRAHALDEQARAFTLLWHVYSEGQRAVSMLLWGKGDYRAVLPSFMVGVGQSAGGDGVCVCPSISRRSGAIWPGMFSVGWRGAVLWVGAACVAACQAGHREVLTEPAVSNVSGAGTTLDVGTTTRAVGTDQPVPRLTEVGTVSNAGVAQSLIGVPVPVRSFTDASLRDNRLGLSALKKKDYARSVQHFRQALVLAPDHVMARYNLSCALVALGQLDTAADELRRVLQSDLPQFRSRLMTDADLLPLRQSAGWKAIEQQLGELDLAWHKAATTLLPVVYLPRAERVSTTSYEQSQAVPYARAGVYSSTDARFIPLGQPVERTLGLSMTTDGGQVVGFSGEGGLDVEATIQRLREHRSKSDGQTPPVIRKSTDALWFMADAPLDGGKVVLHDYRSDFVAPIHKTLRVTAFGATFVRAFEPLDVNAAVQRLPSQARAHYAAVIKGSELEGDRSNLMRDWERLPNGILLFTIGGHCKPGDVSTPHRHFVHYVSTSGETHVLFDAAPGGGAIRLVGDIVMVQSGEDTLLLDAKNPTVQGAARLPKGLYLSIPFTEHGCTRGI